MDNRWTSSSHVTYNCGYHFIWCPKYRRKILFGDIETGPSDSPTFIASQLKGFTSRTLRAEFASLRSRLPTLWTRSFYVETIGHISEATIKKYIEEQKTK